MARDDDPRPTNASSRPSAAAEQGRRALEQTEAQRTLVAVQLAHLDALRRADLPRLSGVDACVRCGRGADVLVVLNGPESSGPVCTVCVTAAERTTVLTALGLDAVSEAALHQAKAAILTRMIEAGRFGELPADLSERLARPGLIDRLELEAQLELLRAAEAEMFGE